MIRLRGVLTAVVAVLASMLLAPGVSAAAPPEGACTDPAPAQPAVPLEPWAQRMLHPESVWQHSTGADVLVAVVDSGVSAEHSQLDNGNVLPGQDFYLVGDYPGAFDCVSHGTAVASIIAADEMSEIGFTGLAPGATILPVRVSERAVSDDGDATRIDFGVLADGIRYAADQGAKVINLSLAGQVDNDEVRAAVAYAQGKDALVVAAAGNGQERAGRGGMTYPAGYDGVLGVGAVDMAGQRVAGSRIGPQVDIVAPGADVLAATRMGGHQYCEGTSFATPFVSATAALVRSAWPELSAAEVATRLKATATAAPGGRDSHAYGAGIVNPYRAVTERLTDAEPAPLPDAAPTPVDPEQERVAAWWQRMDTGARIATGAASGGVLLGVAAALALARGRRDGWRARRGGPLPEARDPAAETPDQVFLLPPPESERG